MQQAGMKDIVEALNLHNELYVPCPEDLDVNFGEQKLSKVRERVTELVSESDCIDLTIPGAVKLDPMDADDHWWYSNMYDDNGNELPELPSVSVYPISGKRKIDTFIYQFFTAALQGPSLKGHKLIKTCGNPLCCNPTHMLAIPSKMVTAITTLTGMDYRETLATAVKIIRTKYEVATTLEKQRIQDNYIQELISHVEILLKEDNTLSYIMTSIPDAIGAELEKTKRHTKTLTALTRALVPLVNQEVYETPAQRVQRATIMAKFIALAINNPCCLPEALKDLTTGEIKEVR